MVSGFVSECDGFLNFSEEELVHVEEMYQEPLELTRSIPKLLGSNVGGCSAVCHFYGKNKDGYWDNEKVMKHTK